MVGCLVKLTMLALVVALALFLCSAVVDGVQTYELTHMCHGEVRTAGNGSVQNVIVCPVTPTPGVSPQ